MKRLGTVLAESDGLKPEFYPLFALVTLRDARLFINQQCTRANCICALKSFNAEPQQAAMDDAS